MDQSTASAIITKVKEDLELRYKNRSKYHAKSEVFERIKVKLNEIRETDGKELTEKGKMLKELLENRRKKKGEMRSLRLPINLNEIATKYNQSLIYITVRDIMTFKDNVSDTPMDTGWNNEEMSQKKINQFFSSSSNLPPKKRRREEEHRSEVEVVVNRTKKIKTVVQSPAVSGAKNKRKSNTEQSMSEKRSRKEDVRTKMETEVDKLNEDYNQVRRTKERTANSPKEYQ